MITEVTSRVKFVKHSPEAPARNVHLNESRDRSPDNTAELDPTLPGSVKARQREQEAVPD